MLYVAVLIDHAHLEVGTDLKEEDNLESFGLSLFEQIFFLFLEIWK